MRIAVAQTRPAAGDIQRNIEGHLRLIGLAVADGAELVVFPELSITGYEPTLVEESAVSEDDRRFDPFQDISSASGISIGIGAPTRNENGICISVILIQPRVGRKVYSKMHLHRSEERYFVAGPKSANLLGEDGKTALAICYELSVPEHAANASRNGAETYLGNSPEIDSRFQHASGMAV